MAENPEWEQIGMATQAGRENIEQFLNGTKEYWGLIYARYQGNTTLEMLMRHLDPERYPMAKGDKILRENKGARLWAIGSFWVFAFVCVAGMIILLASMVSPWVILPSWGDPQVLTGYILHDVLESERPSDGLAYLALTASDLWRRSSSPGGNLTSPLLNGRPVPAHHRCFRATACLRLKR